jgi:hypothetical protein
VKADQPQKHKARRYFSGIYRHRQHLISVVDSLDGPEDHMRVGIKRIAGVAATIALALHTILWAAVAPFAAPAVDPFTVICHSEASVPADQIPGGDALPPAHACDHCNLCSALAPPVPINALSATLTPARILLVLRPAVITPRRDVTADPKLARGPPALA